MYKQALVVGAGPAGLAVSRELSVLGIDHLVLEAGTVGASWESYYRSLVLHTGRHLSRLPGLPFPPGTPLFPPRALFLAYLRDYAARFRLPIREGARVSRAAREGDAWRVETGAGGFAGRALVVATGIAGNPVRPAFPGEADFRGEILHSIAYREPGPFRGRRTLVVGTGNSGGEIAAELGNAGVETAVAVRSGSHLMPLRILGVPAQYWSVLLEALPAPWPGRVAAATARALRLLKGAPPLPVPGRGPLERAPLIGDSLPAALRAGRVSLRPALEGFAAEGARFRDGSVEPFDAVILATGFRPALGFLGNAVVTDAAGFPRPGGAPPGLFFVGHRYGATGAVFNIRRDAPRVAGAVARHVRGG